MTTNAVAELNAQAEIPVCAPYFFNASERMPDLTPRGDGTMTSDYLLVKTEERNYWIVQLCFDPREFEDPLHWWCVNTEDALTEKVLEWARIDPFMHNGSKLKGSHMATEIVAPAGDGWTSISKKTPIPQSDVEVFSDKGVQMATYGEDPVDGFCFVENSKDDSKDGAEIKSVRFWRKPAYQRLTSAEITRQEAEHLQEELEYAKDALKDAESFSGGWISIGDELPKEDETVMTCNAEIPFFEIARLTPFSGFERSADSFFSLHDEEFIHVTHWRPTKLGLDPIHRGRFISSTTEKVGSDGQVEASLGSAPI